MAAKSSKPTTKSKQSVIARSDDGSIQITFTVPFKLIDKTRKATAEELGRDITVPGFRRGKAPLAKLLDHIPQDSLIEKTLSKILPGLINSAIKQHKIRPSIYPKFELVKAVDGEDWQIRAKTAEIPEFTLGNYKSQVRGALRASKIWTPKDANAKSKLVKSTKENLKQLSRTEKEQLVIKTLLETINVKIPKMFIEEEVNSKLSNLLERLEKLGLTLESYLSSIGKTADQVRKEYEKQSNEFIALSLILSKIADKEGVKIDKKQVDEAIRISSADKNLAKDFETDERRKLIEEVLRKREVLNMLVALG
jgi:FKBP-type peptidyl-prolyl cis-trans isomerase (trigger factor)